MNASNNISTDEWLSEITNREVYKAVIDGPFFKMVSSRRSNDLSEKCKIKPVFIYSKVPTNEIKYIKLLIGYGFYLVDTNVVFDNDSNLTGCIRGNVIIRLANREDEAQTIDVARKAFIYSRFHLDDQFSQETADLIKAEWVRNFFNGKRGKYMIVAEVEKKIVGFTQLLVSPDNDMITIDLIGVDSLYRRNGIANDMILNITKLCNKYDKIIVGTQISNIPSIRLYEKMGFRMTSSQYVFHYHYS